MKKSVYGHGARNFGAVTVTAVAAVVGSAFAGGAALAATGQAGVAAAVVGKVDVTRDQAGKAAAAAVGMDMFLQDRIETGDKSRMQVLLLDETIFSVGANTDLMIDEFVYDPESSGAKLAATYSKGVFRYVSGKVAGLKPENVSVKIPGATIGIRGTSLFVLDDTTTDNPDDVFVGLLGPGPLNNANLPKGGMDVTNDLGKTVIEKSGFGVRVVPGQRPSPAIKTPAMLVNRLQSAITGINIARPAKGAAPVQLEPVKDPEGASGQRLAGVVEIAANDQSTGLVKSFIKDNEETAGQDTFGEEANKSSPATEPGQQQTAQNFSDAEFRSFNNPVPDPNGPQNFGGHGLVRGQLVWTDTSDLDLNLALPGGAGTVFKSAQSITFNDGGATGQIDVINDGLTISVDPDRRVENIIVTGTNIPAGSYTFFVSRVDSRGNTLTNYDVLLTGDGGQTSREEVGSFSLGGPDVGPNFVVNSAGGSFP